MMTSIYKGEAIKYRYLPNRATYELESCFNKALVHRVFDKTTYSRFTSEFKEFLKNEKFDRLYFCGVNTDCCVLATVISCYDNVQDCIVLADLCASTLGEIKHNHALDLLRDNITPERVINSWDYKE